MTIESIKVKPLEWTTVGSGIWRGQGRTGSYEVWHQWASDATFRASAHISPYTDVLIGNGYGSFEDATDAAQADYERRILSALSHSPVEQAPAPCQTCEGSGKEGRHSICRDCDEIPAPQVEQENSQSYPQSVTINDLDAARKWLSARWCVEHPNEGHVKQLAEYAASLRAAPPVEQTPAPVEHVRGLEWRRSGWIEAFAKPEGLGLWYSIQPAKPVHGPGEPPFTCNAIWGEPGQNMRDCLGEDFLSLGAAKIAAQEDFAKRVQSVLNPPPQPRTAPPVESGTGAEHAIRCAGLKARDELLERMADGGTVDNDLADYMTRIIDACVKAAVRAPTAHTFQDPKTGETVRDEVEGRPATESHVRAPDTATVAAHMKDFEGFVAKTAPKLHWKVYQDLGADPARSNGYYDGWQHGFGEALFGPLPLPQLMEEMKASVATKVAALAAEGQAE